MRSDEVADGTCSVIDVCPTLLVIDHSLVVVCLEACGKNRE